MSTLVGLALLIVALLHSGWTWVLAAEKVVVGAAQGSGLWPFWIAHEAGYFRQSGLDVDFVLTGSSTVTISALIGGDLFVSAGGSGPGISAVAGGAPIVLIGRCGRPPFSLYSSDPKVRVVKDLKGKIVASGSGQSSDIVLRDILQRNGMKYGDVQIIYQSDLQARYTALLTRRVSATVLNPPYDLLAKKAGLREIVDFNTFGSPLMFCGIWAKRNSLEQRSETLERVMRAFVQAVARFKKDKPYALLVFNKYTRNTDPEIADHTYQRQVDLVPRKPYVEDEGLQLLIDSLVDAKPELKVRAPREFYDNRFIKRLDDAGFIDGQYK